MIPKQIVFPKEGGLLGSQAVAKEYEKRGTNVIAMSQVGWIFTRRICKHTNFYFKFDMTAWVKKNTREEVGIIVDYVDPECVMSTITLEAIA